MNNTLWIGSSFQQMWMLVAVLGLLGTAGAAITTHNANHELTARRASLAAVAAMLIAVAATVLAFTPG